MYTQAMSAILEALATASTGLFAGAALYVNLVEHPARMSCGTELAATEWAPSYKRATLMQAPLAIVAFVCAATAWILGAGTSTLVAAILIGLVVPFTFLVILPTNKRLLSGSLDKRSAETRRLLDKWNLLHGVRTALALAAFILFLL
jgi:hypothetical protein